MTYNDGNDINGLYQTGIWIGRMESGGYCSEYNPFSLYHDLRQSQCWYEGLGLGQSSCS